MALMSEPHATHREVELLDTLRSLGGSARTGALAEALGVSEETIRRTVKALAKADLVRRVHGGVYLTNKDAQAPVTSRLEKQSREKTDIARAVSQLIPDGACIFLDVGSTTAFVAAALEGHHNLTVITNAITPAQALVGRNGNRVFLACGELTQLESGTFGPATHDYVAQFNIDTAILSIDGLDTRNGFLLMGDAEADLARAVMRRAQQCVVVADHSKFGQFAPFGLGEPSRIDVLVTDRDPRPMFRDKLADWAIDLVVAASAESS